MSPKGKGRRRQQESDPFSCFKQAVTDTFEPLVTDFAFRQVGVVECMPECVINYRNDTTGVGVRYEWKSQVRVDTITINLESYLLWTTARHRLVDNTDRIS